jgi:(+)-abscisic acid 8'-hydroxylase
MLLNILINGWLQIAPKPNTFMPFGNGVHSCPGNELAKLNMLILIHHLVTKFRYILLNFFSSIFYLFICNMSVLIIYLVVLNNLIGRWEVVENRNGIQYSPFPIPLQGLPTRFCRIK